MKAVLVPFNNNALKTRPGGRLYCTRVVCLAVWVAIMFTLCLCYIYAYAIIDISLIKRRAFIGRRRRSNVMLNCQFCLPYIGAKIFIIKYFISLGRVRNLNEYFVSIWSCNKSLPFTVESSHMPLTKVKFLVCLSHSVISRGGWGGWILYFFSII